jgi:hypothetical protein
MRAFTLPISSRIIEKKENEWFIGNGFFNWLVPQLIARIGIGKTEGK